MSTEKPLTEQELTEKARTLIQQFGQTLGLDPEFVAAVAADGQSAVIDRAELVDQTGAQAVALRMVQQLGVFMQGQAESQGDMRSGVILEMAERIGKQNGVDEDLAVMLLGSVLEVFQQTVKRLKKSGVTNDTVQ